MTTDRHGTAYACSTQAGALSRSSAGLGVKPSRACSHRKRQRDGDVGRVGYEINFNRYFYKYIPPRPLEQIDAEMKALEAEIAGLLKEVAG